MAEFLRRRPRRLDSGAGVVSCWIIRVHFDDLDCGKHRHRASRDDPQRKMQSGKTVNIAAHEGDVLAGADHWPAGVLRTGRRREARPLSELRHASCAASGPRASQNRGGAT